jgi:hypothetical protein
MSLGLNPSIGVEIDVQKRCQIYRQRILEHFERLKKADEARKKNESRFEVHTNEKAIIQKMSTKMDERQVWEACHSLSLSQLETLMKKRCNLNTESPRGLTALITMVLMGASEDLITKAIYSTRNKI